MVANPLQPLSDTSDRHFHILEAECMHRMEGGQPFEAGFQMNSLKYQHTTADSICPVAIRLKELVVSIIAVKAGFETCERGDRRQQKGLRHDISSLQCIWRLMAIPKKWFWSET